MSKLKKQISNPFSTSGGGYNFENQVGSSFVTLMLSGGYVPTFSTPWTIKEISFQKKGLGYNTDDIIVSLIQPNRERNAKLLCQVKRSINVGKNKEFIEVIENAWEDFNKHEIFTKGQDSIAIITSTLSKTDIEDSRTILEWARHKSMQEFFIEVELAKSSSQGKIKKLNIFRELLNNANCGNKITNEELWSFLKSIHLLGYDLDIKEGVTLSLLHSLIAQYHPENAHNIWKQIYYEVELYRQNAGTIKIESLPDDIREAFQKPEVQKVPTYLGIKPSIASTIDFNFYAFASNLANAILLGGWDEN